MIVVLVCPSCWHQALDRMPICASCSLNCPKDEFSAAQLRKTSEKRRCVRCIADCLVDVSTAEDMTCVDGDGKLTQPLLFNWRTTSDTPTNMDVHQSGKAHDVLIKEPAVTADALSSTVSLIPSLAQDVQETPSGRRAIDWPMATEMLEHFGVQVCGGPSEPAGRSLEVATGFAFQAGEVIMREAPAACVHFDEPWSPLETALTSHFGLSKIAPPYRLLARILTVGDASHFDEAGVVQSMGANMEVAESPWNVKFCSVCKQGLGHGAHNPPRARILLSCLPPTLCLNALPSVSVPCPGLCLP